MAAALALAVLALLAPQNVDHPGLVHLGNDEWGTPDQARERGMILHQGRWFPKELEKDLRKWEKEDAKGLDWKDNYRTKSKYYRIQTNVPRHLIELDIKPFLDELFETYLEVFERDFGLSGKAVKNKDIRIYHGFNAYSVNEPDGDKPRPRTNPGFIVSGSVLVVFYDETDPGQFYWTVFHEGAHQFFISLLPGASPPIWLSEALACYFEGCSYSRATRKITRGFVPGERSRVSQSILGNGQEHSAQALFLDVPQERFLGQEYALAWSFVHYLIHRPGEEVHERFARFVQETNGAGAKPVAEIFAKATGEDLDALIPGWKAHVLALAPPPEISWVAVSPKDGQEDLKAGDLLWSFDGVEVFSVAQFGELWKKRPKDRPYELVVVRCEPDRSSPESTRRFVRVTIEPTSTTLLRPVGEFPRNSGLSD
jgi:hypothetical protein